MIGKGGKYIKKGDWKSYIAAYFLAIDYTDKGILDRSRPQGHPWTISKAQDNFLYLSDMVDKEAIPDPHNVDLELSINQEVKQSDNTKNMHFKIYD
mmetsp:Transcript_15796/g.11464  ORF Transcript_15796/g.11464 Transcript_15796/m.11464 type:complete len:96 (-) Transcript_15796:212-499(-)